MIELAWRASKIVFFASCAAWVDGDIAAQAAIFGKAGATAFVLWLVSLVLISFLKDAMERGRRARRNGGVDPGEYRGH